MASEQLFVVGNFTRPTAAAPVKQPTGTAVRTMLQLATQTAEGLYIVEWGVSMDASSGGVPVQVELFGCTGAATMSTALVAADVQNFTAPLLPAPSALQFGTTALSGFATAAVTEGTVANYRPIDVQQLPASGPYVKQWPLGREPAFSVSTFIRVRVTAAASVNMSTYVIFGEQ